MLKQKAPGDDTPGAFFVTTGFTAVFSLAPDTGVPAGPASGVEGLCSKFRAKKKVLEPMVD